MKILVMLWLFIKYHRQVEMLSPQCLMSYEILVPTLIFLLELP